MTDVGLLEEFQDRSVTVVRAGDREIGIVRWADRVYAVRNLCAHEKGPLCLGNLRPGLTGQAPGSIELDESAPVMACPWHGWEFDLRTGKAVWDDRYSVRCYPVRLEGGRVLIDLESGRS